MIGLLTKDETPFHVVIFNPERCSGLIALKRFVDYFDQQHHDSIRLAWLLSNGTYIHAPPICHCEFNADSLYVRVISVPLKIVKIGLVIKGVCIIDNGSVISQNRQVMQILKIGQVVRAEYEAFFF